MSIMVLSGLPSIVFVILTFLVLKGFLWPLDNRINELIPLATTGFLYIFSRGLAVFYVLLILTVILLVLGFSLKKQLSEAVFVLASFSGGVVAELILKPIFNIPCPATNYNVVLANKELFGLLPTLQSIGFVKACYPSGHVAGYVVVCGYLAYLTLRLVSKKWLRFIVLCILLGTVILIGPSRLYLHLHWFSDIVAGYLLGFSLLLLLVGLRKRFAPYFHTIE